MTRKPTTTYPVLLQRGHREELEQLRFHGSTNRAYWVPLGEDADEFIIVKLLPGWRTAFKMTLKWPLRRRNVPAPSYVGKGFPRQPPCVARTSAMDDGV